MRSVKLVPWALVCDLSDVMQNHSLKLIDVNKDTFCRFFVANFVKEGFPESDVSTDPLRLGEHSREQGTISLSRDRMELVIELNPLSIHSLIVTTDHHLQSNITPSTTTTLNQQSTPRTQHQTLSNNHGILSSTGRILRRSIKKQPPWPCWMRLGHL